MKKNKLGLIIFLSIAAISLMACGSSKKESTKKNAETTSVVEEQDFLASLGLKNQNDVDTLETPLNIEVQPASYMWAPTLEGKILEADNIFVATVMDMTTVYPHLDENKKPIQSMPTTNFELEILSNIRGDLPEGEIVKAMRAGFGINKETGTFITTIENDIIPEKGKTYVFLTRVIDGILVIQNGGDVPSNFPLEEAPMDLNKQPEKVVEEIIENSQKVDEVGTQVENEQSVLDKIGDTLFNSPEIKARIEGHGNEPDLNKVVVK